MDKQQALDQLDKFKGRLTTDVAIAYAQLGDDFGREHFAACDARLRSF